MINHENFGEKMMGEIDIDKLPDDLTIKQLLGVIRASGGTPVIKIEPNE